VKALDREIPLPDFVSELMTRTKEATLIENDYEAFKAYLIG
jgi:hypothetical protein